MCCYCVGDGSSGRWSVTFVANGCVYGSVFYSCCVNSAIGDGDDDTGNATAYRNTNSESTMPSITFIEWSPYLLVAATYLTFCLFWTIVIDD